jgi:5-methyltetrahydrofolate--homocysteine methyltransferase
VSGGISNISFSFSRQQCRARSNAFGVLYHAIRAGLDMGIVNAGMLEVYEEIPKELLELVEDVLLNRRPDGTERLVAFAETLKNAGKARVAVEDAAWRRDSVEARLSHALVKGIVDFIENRHRGGAAKIRKTAQRNRGTAHGGNERGGGLVWFGQNVLRKWSNQRE